MKRTTLGLLGLAAAAIACRDTAGPDQPALLRADQVSAGAAHTCAVMEDGRAVCWGRGAGGALGTSAATTAWRPVFVETDESFRQISAGGGHTCGVTVAGAALCWGANQYGQLGVGDAVTSLIPRSVTGELVFREMSAGLGYTCGVTTDGAAYCWGRNSEGQLGDGSTVTRQEPSPVAGELRFETIQAGERHTCGVAVGGTAYCWGSNDVAQLGEGFRVERSLVPNRVNRDLTFREVSPGEHHTCGVTTANRAYCWGSNANGELGHGYFASGIFAATTEPDQVLGPWSFGSISAGAGYTCAIVEGMIARCWGSAKYGQIGPNAIPQPFADASTPRLVDLELRFTQVSTGGTHACGRSTQRAVHCWGTGEEGQLGNGGEWWSDIPLRVIAPFD